MLAIIRVLLFGLLILAFTVAGAATQGAQARIRITITRGGSVGPTGIAGFQGSTAAPLLDSASTTATVTHVRAVSFGKANAEEPRFVATIAKPAAAGGAPILSLWTISALSERAYRGNLIVGKSKFDLDIEVSAGHDLKADGTTSKVYVVGSASGSIMLLLKSALGLQDVPNGELRLRIENQSELAPQISVRRVALYDANGVPVLSPVLQGTFVRRERESTNETKPIARADPKSQSVPGGGSTLVFLDLTGKPIQPGTYTGYVEVESPGPTTFTQLPFKLDVRDYPFAVLLLMVVFTFVGYMVFWLSGPRQAYAQQLASIDCALAELRQMEGHNDDACDRLQRYSKYLWQRVDPDSPALGPLLQTDVRTDKTWLGRFRTFLGDVWPWSSSSKPDPTLDASLSTDIASLRAVIGAGIRLTQLAQQTSDQRLAADQQAALQTQITKVWKSIVEIDTQAATTGISQIMGELFDPDSIVVGAGAAAGAAADEAAKPAMVVDSSPSQKLTMANRNPALVQRYLGGTSIRMVAHVANDIQTIQNVRRLTSAVGIFILFSIGMNILYINVPGFGHSVYDYIKVIAWSFTTGAAGRGLSTTIGSWAQSLLI